MQESNVNKNGNKASANESLWVGEDFDDSVLSEENRNMTWEDVLRITGESEDEAATDES